MSRSKSSELGPLKGPHNYQIFGYNDSNSLTSFLISYQNFYLRIAVSILILQLIKTHSKNGGIQLYCYLEIILLLRNIIQ